MNKIRFIYEDIEDWVCYWFLGKYKWSSYYVTKEERFDEFKQVLWRLYRKALCCPLGKHYVKWNSGDPKCIICWRRYNEIFK